MAPTALPETTCRPAADTEKQEIRPAETMGSTSDEAQSLSRGSIADEAASEGERQAAFQMGMWGLTCVGPKEQHWRAGCLCIWQCGVQQLVAA